MRAFLALYARSLILEAVASQGFPLYGAGPCDPGSEGHLEYEFPRM